MIGFLFLLKRLHFFGTILKRLHVIPNVFQIVKDLLFIVCNTQRAPFCGCLVHPVLILFNPRLFDHSLQFLLLAV